MAASDDYASSSDYASSFHEPTPAPASLNTKLMVSAIILLFLIVFFISSLHIYGKWLWRWNPPPRSGNLRDPVTDAEASYIRAGLDKAAISLLPTFLYSPAEAEKGADSLECAVCLSEFQEDEKGRMLPACKHSFHIECIDMWFYSHSTCPLCRTIVKPDDSASSSSPALTQEQGQAGEEEALDREAQRQMAATSASPTITESSETRYSTEVFFQNDQTLIVGSPSRTSRKSLIVGPGTPSPSSTRHAPHITIEIPNRQHGYIIPSPASGLSLSSRRSRGASPIPEQESSPSLKSPGLRVLSLTRMMSSKGKRVFNLQEGSAE